jgi:DNA-binding transcriptional LysR family regulator
MELRQLEYFVAVAEEASFTKAAARVHVAQPGVSAQIRRLERELGQELLDRSGRDVRLTAAGAAVLPYARAALHAASGIRLAVDELAGLVRGQVAVGTAASHTPVDLPAVLAGFRQDHPAVEITLSEAGSELLVEGLRGGTLDLALIEPGTEPPRGIDTQIVVDEELVVAVGPGDPLAGNTSLTLQAIGRRPLITLPRGTGLRSRVEAAYAAAGLRPRVAFEVSGPGMVARLAGQGLGVAIVPDSAARAFAGTVHSIPLAEPPLRTRLALAWRAAGPSGPAARAFIAHARKTLPDLPSGEG